jgi:HdeA/HdeB family
MSAGKERTVYKSVLLAVGSFVTMYSTAFGQVPLSRYVDANGYIDVQKLTCAQLAGTFQEDADMLTTWYSGWYNGLAKKHFLNVRRGKEVEHEVIVYCKANPDKLIIQAIAVVFKDERASKDIEMKEE